MNEENAKASMVFCTLQMTVEYYKESDEEVEESEEVDELDGMTHVGTFRRTEFGEQVYWEFLSEAYTWVALTKEHDSELLSELNTVFNLGISGFKTKAMFLNTN